MSAQTRHLLGAFAAMVFVGASWGANLPVTKVMLLHFDLIPMAAVRTVAAAVALALLLWIVEGTRALRIDLSLGRFLALGLLRRRFLHRDLVARLCRHRRGKDRSGGNVDGKQRKAGPQQSAENLVDFKRIHRWMAPQREKEGGAEIAGLPRAMQPV